MPATAFTPAAPPSAPPSRRREASSTNLPSGQAAPASRLRRSEGTAAGVPRRRKLETQVPGRQISRRQLSGRQGFGRTRPGKPHRTAYDVRGRPGSGIGSIGSWFRGKRRLAIALLFCCAAGLTVHQLTPAPTDTVTVLAAARDLPAGASLAATDLVRLSVPPELVVEGTFTESSDLAGKQLASPVLRSQILTTTQLLGQGLLAGAEAGSTAVPLRMADPASIQLLSPGQLVNIVKSSDGSYGTGAPSEVLAQAVAVLWTSGKGGQSSEWLGSGETEGLVVVAASPSQAERLAGASSQGKLFFVMVGAGGGA